VLHLVLILDPLHHLEDIRVKTTMEDLPGHRHLVNMEVLHLPIKHMEELHLKTMVMVQPVLQVKDMEELRHQVKVMVELRLQVKDGGAPPPSQGYGGAPPPNQGYGGAPPPNQFGGVDAKVQQWFNAVDQDRSGQIDFKELQRALVNGNWSNFSEEACRMMVDMFDRDKTGQINLQEFSSLFNYINQWKSLFESIDRDRSGFIEQAELTQAFNQMGYRFTPTFIQNVLSKYEPRTRRLTLDNFIVVCVQIKRLTDSFRTRDREMRGQAMLQYEDFIGLALGAHK